MTYLNDENKKLFTSDMQVRSCLFWSDDGEILPIDIILGCCLRTIYISLELSIHIQQLKKIKMEWNWAQNQSSIKKRR